MYTRIHTHKHRPTHSDISHDLSNPHFSIGRHCLLSMMLSRPSVSLFLHQRLMRAGLRRWLSQSMLQLACMVHLPQQSEAQMPVVSARPRFFPQKQHCFLNYVTHSTCNKAAGCKMAQQMNSNFNMKIVFSYEKQRVTQWSNTIEMIINTGNKHGSRVNHRTGATQ